ncbi:quinone oxidoreductase family protein [Cohnella sp. JJ-181]|uniref:quinone oxidoreductase family protein n=1 Tax=Cohnella rhizoplanae TaxID=2974897 RepID=UPI0022FF8EE7|nr:zinc-binding dehydrogenase [Cohnella sp. JJ-181]CAI6084435.1 Quinone oxidoreductase 1 [Cohnella sp. JJ-181]
MQAFVVEQAGDDRIMKLQEGPNPEALPGQLTIDVVYAGVGMIDSLLSRGYLGLPTPFVPGLEVSGYVRSVGAGVEGFRIGQPVVAMTLTELGGYASVVSARPELTVPLEGALEGLGMDRAAALAVNAATAYLAVKRVAQVQPGQDVLVHGALGGLGSLVGQVARRQGAGLVLGTVGSAAKRDAAGATVYDKLLLRGEFKEETLRLTGGKGVHHVFDPVGGETRTRSFETLQPLARLVLLGNASDEADTELRLNEAWLGNRAALGLNIGAYAAFAPDAVGEALSRALAMAARGEVDADIYGVYPMAEADRAFRLLEQGGTTGKLLLRV